MKVMHFDSPEARLAFLKGKFEEIIPQEVKKEKKARKGKKKDEVQAE